jgi:hypothetical protein
MNNNSNKKELLPELTVSIGYLVLKGVFQAICGFLGLEAFKKYVWKKKDDKKQHSEDVSET